MAHQIRNPAYVNDATPTMAPGTIVNYDGKFYKYVQFKDAVTYVAGHICVYADATGTSVTNDFAGGSALGSGTTNGPAGICLCVMTQNYYGFIQLTGVATVVCDGSVAAGESVVPELAGPTDGTADTMAAGEEHLVFGTALAADSGSPVTTLVALKGLM